MKTQFHRSRRPGRASAAVMASAAMLGASFALAAASSATASADPTSGTTPVTTVVPNISSASLSQIQARAARAITNRVNSLNFVITQLGNDASFLGTDGTTLTTDMKNDITGLQTLGNTIAGDTSVTQAETDYRSIFTTYRVYLFVLPDANLVINTDRDVNVTIPAVQKDITTLLGEVTSSTPPRVTKLLNGAQALLGDATTATNGLSAQLLGYTAAEWNANPKLLSTAAGAVNHAHWDLTRARLDVTLANKLLTGGRAHGKHGHGKDALPPFSTTSTTTSTTTTTVAG